MSSGLCLWVCLQTRLQQKWIQLAKHRTYSPLEQIVHRLGNFEDKTDDCVRDLLGFDLWFTEEQFDRAPTRIAS
jgi:hypothetical protein